jgi:signal transduction histidine kinase
VAATIPGTGIGLANVRHAIERHGGTVAIDSTEGAGTTVTVRLPLLQADQREGQSGLAQ